jgi:hypothetical protein
MLMLLAKKIPSVWEVQRTRLQTCWSSAGDLGACWLRWCCELLLTFAIVLTICAVGERRRCSLHERGGGSNVLQQTPLMLMLMATKIPFLVREVQRTRLETCCYTSRRVERTKWAGGVCFGTIQRCFSDLHTHRWASTRQRLQRRMWSDKFLRVLTTYQANLAKGTCVVVEAKF